VQPCLSVPIAVGSHHKSTSESIYIGIGRAENDTARKRLEIVAGSIETLCRLPAVDILYG
jgi:hypothetical protein